MKKHFLQFLVLQFLLVVAGQAQKSYTIKFNPKAGSSYYVVTNSDTRVVQNVMGQDMEINMINDGSVSYDIENAGENKLIKMTYDKLKMDMDMMGQKMVMDSEDADTSNAASKMFRQLKGAQLSITIQPDGKVVAVEGADDIINRMNVDAQQKTTLEGVLGEDALRHMMEMSFGFYPGKPVKVGETWTSESTLDKPFPMTSTNTHTLTRVEGDRAFVHTVSQLKTPEGATMTQMGIELGLDLGGEVASDTEIELGSGMPLNMNAEQHLKGNFEAQGQKIPMAMNSKTTMAIEKK
ncbi:DUF6263 family protein [Niabella terrae]